MSSSPATRVKHLVRVTAHAQKKRVKVRSRGGLALVPRFTHSLTTNVIALKSLIFNIYKWELSAALAVLNQEMNFFRITVKKMVARSALVIFLKPLKANVGSTNKRALIT